MQFPVGIGTEGRVVTISLRTTRATAVMVFTTEVLFHGESKKTSGYNGANGRFRAYLPPPQGKFVPIANWPLFFLHPLSWIYDLPSGCPAWEVVLLFCNPPPE